VRVRRDQCAAPVAQQRERGALRGVAEAAAASEPVVI
jgi:hypothetical protein